MPDPLLSTVILPVPQAADAVDRWREETSDSKPSSGMPAHVTLIFPFVPAARLDQGVVEALAEAIGDVGAFEFALRRAGRFPATLYLAPEPASTFVALIETIVRHFPEYPPYEGAFDSVVPHLTVADGDASLMDRVEADVERFLPIESVAQEALLLEEVETDRRHWQVRARLPLAV